MNQYHLDLDRAFEQVQPMLRKLAWNYAKVYPIEYDEALSESYYSFTVACQNYDPTRGSKLSSYVYYVTNNRLKSLIMKRARVPEILPINEEIAGAAPCHRFRYELAQELSRDACEIVSLLLEVPGEVLEELPTSGPRTLLARVMDYLWRQGHDPERLTLAKQEIREWVLSWDQPPRQERVWWR